MCRYKRGHLHQSMDKFCENFHKGLPWTNCCSDPPWTWPMVGGILSASIET